MKAKQWLRSINEVLYREWDPIGACLPEGETMPEDEYDSYSGPVATLLLKGATDREIAAYLFRVESEAMGLGGTFSESRFSVVIAVLRGLGLPEQR